MSIFIAHNPFEKRTQSSINRKTRSVLYLKLATGRQVRRRGSVVFEFLFLTELG